MKSKFNKSHFFLCLSFLVYFFLLNSSQYALFGEDSIYLHYQDNLFPISFLGSFLDFPLLTKISFLFIPIAFLHYFFPNNKPTLLLALFTMFIISQINQTFTGIDTAIFSYYFACRLIDNKNLFSHKNIFFAGLIFIYFACALVKLQMKEWQSLEMLLFLIKTNSSTLNLDSLSRPIEYLLKLMTLSVLIIEGTSPLMFLGKKFQKVGHLSFLILHLGALFILRIPHLSLFLCAIHYGFYRSLKLSEQNESES